MLSWLKKHYKSFALALILGLFSQYLWATKFSADVQKVIINLKKTSYTLNADINFKLSKTAKEAFQKGIPLTWVVKIKVKQEGFIWDKTIKSIELEYLLKNHALLNLYSVKELNNETQVMFSTLAATLNSISKIRNLELIETTNLDPNNTYIIAIKVLFNREALPIPLRPLSYFDPQWDLSSHWTLWPLEN